MENKTPLVSVIVVTYNSSKFVIETLDSIYNQTYSNIELIISDDCSTDKTIEICKHWINENKIRFKNVEIITSEKNTGIPANCNRGYAKANGEWIKEIAGDDCLYPNAIEKYINYVNSHNTEILFSSMDIFQNNFEESSKIKSHLSPSPIFKFNKAKASEQFKLLTLGNAIYAPSIFIKKELFERVDKYDEEIRLCEDWPMWLKITQKGYVFHYLDDVLVKYRKYNESTWGKQTTTKKYIITDKEDLINERYIYPYVNCIKRNILKLNLSMRKRLNSMDDNSFLSFDLIVLNGIKYLCDKYYHIMHKYYHFRYNKRVQKSTI